MTNKLAETYLGESTLRMRAIEQGRKEIDCAHGEFRMSRFIYNDQFGPERPDYNLDI